MVKPCAVKIGAVGRKRCCPNVRSLCCGANADRLFACACPREELPSFAIGLLKDTVIPATGGETEKNEGFRRGFCCCTIF